MAISSSMNLLPVSKEVELANIWGNLESGNKDMLLSHNGTDC